MFRRKELVNSFADWVTEVTRYDDFPAPGNTLKVFSTVIARKPNGKILNVPECPQVSEARPHGGEAAAQKAEPQRHGRHIGLVANSCHPSTSANPGTTLSLLNPGLSLKK
jgi:hypothetical protein